MKSRVGLSALICVAATAFGFVKAVAQFSLTSVTNIPCNAEAVTISSHYLYTAGSDGLRIFDIANPASPADVGYSNGFGPCDLVVVSDGYVYSLQNGLRIFDNSNPTNPISVGQIPGPWWELSVQDRFAFLTFGSGTISIYGVSNPVSPISLGQIPASGPVAVKAKYAYSANGYSGLLVSDISDPTNPATVGVGYGNVANILVLGDYAYTATVSNALAIYNIMNPTNPIPIANLGLIGQSIALYGNYLLGASGGWVTSSDVSEPTNSVMVAQQFFYPFANVAYRHGLAVSHGYAYTGGGGYLSVISLGTPVAPALSIATTTNTVILSWATPALAFLVQQSPGINPAAWVTLTNVPSVVGSQNQVTISPQPGNMFYRLISE